MFIKNFFLFLLITNLIAMSFAQPRRASGRRDRARQRGRSRASQAPLEVATPERINCHFCSINFALNKFDANNLCYNPNKNLTATDSEYITLCPSFSKFCVVDITRVNNGLTIVDRKCGASTCNYFCIIKGYGVEIETCTHCCAGRVPPVNNDQELNENPVVDYYNCPDLSKAKVIRVERNR